MRTKDVNYDSLRIVFHDQFGSWEILGGLQQDIYKLRDLLNELDIPMVDDKVVIDYFDSRTKGETSELSDAIYGYSQDYGDTWYEKIRDTALKLLLVSAPQTHKTLAWFLLKYEPLPEKV